MESYFVQFRNGIEMIWTRSAEINVALIRPIQKKKYILPYMLISRTNIHEFNLIQLWLDLDPVEIRELHKDSTNLSNEGTRLRVQSDRSWNFFSPVKHAAQSSFSSIFDNHDYVPRVYGGILAIVPGPSISHTSNETGWPVEGKTILNRFGYLNGPANTGSKKRSSSLGLNIYEPRELVIRLRYGSLCCVLHATLSTREGGSISKIDRFAQLVATTTDSDVINSRSVQKEE